LIERERDRKCIDLRLWRTGRECYSQSTRRVQWNQDSRILSNWVVPMTHVNSMPTPPQWGQRHSHPSNPSSSLPIEPETAKEVKRLGSLTSILLSFLGPLLPAPHVFFLHPSYFLNTNYTFTEINKNAMFVGLFWFVGKVEVCVSVEVGSAWWWSVPIGRGW